MHLCCAAGFQHERRVRLYDVDNNWRLRKDVEARNLRWTITDTCISPDQKFLLYSSISPIVHLVRLHMTLQIVLISPAVQLAQLSPTFSLLGLGLVLWCHCTSDKQGATAVAIRGAHIHVLIIAGHTTHRVLCGTACTCGQCTHWPVFMASCCKHLRNH